MESSIWVAVMTCLPGEGHFLAEEKKRHKIEVLKAIEGDECFYGLGDKTGRLWEPAIPPACRLV